MIINPYMVAPSFTPKTTVLLGDINPFTWHRSGSPEVISFMAALGSLTNDGYGALSYSIRQIGGGYVYGDPDFTDSLRSYEPASTGGVTPAGIWLIKPLRSPTYGGRAVAGTLTMVGGKRILGFAGYSAFDLYQY
ncbi:MAG: hypothetical protein WCL08_00175 [Verrucomicrobiota bacterium]